MKKLYLIVSLLAAAALLIAACGPAATPAPATEVPAPAGGLPDLGGREIRIAVENAYNPFNFIDEATGKAVGYDYDLFAEACSRLNCKPTFVQTGWDSIVAVMGGTAQAEFDIAADGITITAERAQNVDFSTP
ncbi:MAG: transporter substrate-binding domain-containing protein, partial [Chloroflexota bacterium]